MTTGGDAYRLKWQTHVPSLCTAFSELRKNECYTDVTLVCTDGQLKAHRLILSACSPFLERMLASHHEPDVIIVLPDLNMSCVRSLVEYIYTGEIAVREPELDRLVEAATLLQIRGIARTGPRPADKAAAVQLSVPDCRRPFEFPSPSLLSQMMSPLLGCSPVKSLLRRSLSRERPALKRRLSGEQETGGELLKKRPGDTFQRCSTPLYVDTNTASSEGRRQSDSDSSEQQRVTTTSADLADDSVSSLNSSYVSEADTNLLNPQVELSEGPGHVRLKPEPSSPLTSPGSAVTSQVNLDEPMDATLGSCVFCKKHFVSSDDLKDHISRVHVTDRLEKHFKCDYCPAAFARSAHLKRHVRTHTGEKPYACTVCPRAFSRQDKLKCHMDRHTEDERKKGLSGDGSLLEAPVVGSGASIQSYLQSLTSPPPPSKPTPPPGELYSSPASSNPGLPYLQHILDEVQIVRDKKPASYYRNIKRLSSESLLHSVRRLGECTIKVATPVE